MERFNRANPRALEQSSASSVSSMESLKKPAYSEYADSTMSTSSRPISIVTPSYMNAAVPARKPVAPKIATTKSNGIHRTEQPIAKGLLLLAIAATPHPSTIPYLEMMLKKGSYSGIVMVGNAEHEAELKQLKMSIYALLGKMSLEVGVQVELQKSRSYTDINAAVTNTMSSGDAIHGVLCTPAYDRNRSLGLDVLDLGESEFEQSWKSSVAFLHSVAKSTLPNLTSSSHLRRGVGAYFLVTGPTENTPTVSVYKAACDSLITLLTESNTAAGLIIDYAENVYVPEPEPIKFNGKLHPSEHNGSDVVHADVSQFQPGESPTKLWNMWALQEQLGAVD